MCLYRNGHKILQQFQDAKTNLTNWLNISLDFQGGLKPLSLKKLIIGTSILNYKRTGKAKWQTIFSSPNLSILESLYLAKYKDSRILTQTYLKVLEVNAFAEHSSCRKFNLHEFLITRQNIGRQINGLPKQDIRWFMILRSRDSNSAKLASAALRASRQSPLHPLWT